MTPAVAILIARKLELNFSGVPFPFRRTAVCMAVSAALAISVAAADCLTAVAVRQNTRAIQAAYPQTMAALWFEGHWGFQFYMAELGASPLDFINGKLKPGDLVIIPSNNTNTLLPAPGKTVLVHVYSQRGSPFLATVNQELGASFYASILGPLPYSFGIVPSEKAFVYSMK